VNVLAVVMTVVVVVMMTTAMTVMATVVEMTMAYARRQKAMQCVIHGKANRQHYHES